MDAKLELLLWTGVSMLFCIVVVNAAYRAQGGRLIRFADETLQGMILREAGLFITLVGIPFAALISGAAGLDLMALGADIAIPDQLIGFTFVNWVRGIGVMAVVVLGILVVLWLGGRAAPPGEPWRFGVLALREAIYNEMHWTFYRAAPALWLGDPYWGVVAGAVLVALEWIMHPEARSWFNTVEGRQYFTVRMACLVSSAFLYLSTQNLWLMIVADLLIHWLGNRAVTQKAVVSRQ
jgi:hypothetical protein